MSNYQKRKKAKKYNSVCDEYPSTPENELTYFELLETMPKRDLVCWVSVRQGYSLEEVAKRILPEYGYEVVSPTTVRNSLLRTHKKLSQILA
jgi:hypothetical protein